MPKPLALSPRDCQGKRWQVPYDLSHLHTHDLIPLHAGELAKAAASMPLALVDQGVQWQLVGVCGLQPQYNLFIRDGEWLGNYRPAWLSTYPFQIMTVGDKGYVTFEQESGLLTQDGGEPFFDEAGQLTPAVAGRVEALKAHQGLQAATQKAVDALRKAKLVIPWPEAVKSPLGLNIAGLHMIDEKALAQLSDDAFLALRKVQALPIAYALNFSISQAHLLQRLASLHGTATDALPMTDHGDLDLDFLSDSGTISFGKLH